MANKTSNFALAIPNDDKLWLPKKYSGWTGFLKTCDTKANESLIKSKRIGADKSGWKWGKYNSTSFQHPLSVAPLIGGQFKVSYTNVDGSGQTPNVGKNVSMRLIAKPANWDETRHVIPLGQSGNPQSKHWKDQFDSGKVGSLLFFLFRRRR